MAILYLCIQIVLVRIVDVSLGIVRTINSVKGRKFTASVIGFIEVFVWFLIVRKALSTDNDSIFIALSYAGGYAIGTYIGGVLSEVFIKGSFGVQVITTSAVLGKIIKENGFGVSSINVHSETQDKFMLFVEIDKNKFETLKKLIKTIDEKAFIVVNETKAVYNGYFSK